MARMTNEELERRLFAKGMRELIAHNRPFMQFVLTQIEDAEIYGETHVPGHPDTSAFNEGRRSRGLQMMRDLEALDPSFKLRLAQAQAAQTAALKPPEPQEDEHDDQDPYQE